LYNNGLFKNPHHEVDRVYIAAVDYDSLGKHMKATSSEYQFFLFLVLIIWLYSLLGEIREMIMLAEFCVVAPAAGDDGGLEAEKNEDGEESYTITGITSGHRTACACICAVRTLLVIYLGVVGCVFLVMETGYMDLLMNAVALAFILEVDEILFGSIARTATTDQLEAVAEIEFETQLPTKGCCGWMLEKDFMGIILFPIACVVIIICHLILTTYPVLDALNCACYQTGSQCLDAQNFGKDWWDNYWSVTLPNSMSAIQTLKR
jgi:hypothetical protein